MNLCLNACDAMPEGGGLLLEASNQTVADDHIHDRVEARAGLFVRLRVADTGVGISVENLPRIFDPFFTTKQLGKGTGLGLAMVFGIVKQHDGWIECRSEAGRGACFDVYLPRLAEGATVDASPPSAPSATLKSGLGQSVLLVDDNEMFASLGGAILRQHGYNVLLAEDGPDAVEVFQREAGRIDLVVLDMTMPRLSGREALERLRRIDPGVRVLFASGYSADQLTEADRARIKDSSASLTVNTTSSRPCRRRSERGLGFRVAPPSATMTGMERLNKFLAHAGVGSRRHCDDLILHGRVSVDGGVVRELGVKVDPESQEVCVDGKPLQVERLVYWLVNKPRGYLCTNHDPAGRPLAVDLVPHVRQRVYTVGRLDEDSEGLLLLTNDGDLAHQLMHPRFGVEKTYLVQVAGKPDRRGPRPAAQGRLPERRPRQGARASSGSKRRARAPGCEIVLSEGKNREIRRMLARLEHKVMRLKRIAIGPVMLGRLRERQVAAAAARAN